ncbi:hypothetical protein OROHE_019041 [Orobanche hederae]
MASKLSKSNLLKFSFILFLIILLLFTIHFLSQILDEFQNKVTPSKLLSNNNPKWFEVIARVLGDENTINVGFVNMDDEIQIEGTQTVNVDFDTAGEDGIKWFELFPEWIDENSPSKCPKIPMPDFESYQELDVVVARVPCEEGDWRSVFRLQVNLVVANLLVKSGRKGSGFDRQIFAVFIGPNGPM